MTDTMIEAIHAGQLLGKQKIFGQVANHKQKQGSQQMAAHRHANERQDQWAVPIDLAALAEPGRILVTMDRYPTHQAFSPVFLHHDHDPYLSIKEVEVLGVSNLHRGAWILAGEPRSETGAVRTMSHAQRRDLSWLTTAFEPASFGIASQVLSDIEALRDGWDGPNSVAPTAEAKKTANAVVAQAAPYLADAEIEIDPTVGNPALHWFSADQQSVVSLTIQDKGSVVIVASTVGGESRRISLKETELEKVGRVLVDAGVGRLNDALR